MHDHARIGGSNAQRDLIDFSLAACLVRDGRRQEARTVLSITRPCALTEDVVAGLWHLCRRRTGSFLRGVISTSHNGICARKFSG
jgi:hypothetical protein